MTFTIGDGLRCILATLVDTRLLVQANSGGGKSWLLRRLLEQTHGKVQHLVIDPEGEFASLRERFDYVHAAKSGADTAADPRAAALLAERLLELKVSAVLDIYELKAHERIRFVKLFLEALVNAPKALWHPVLVIVDEAHVFCPQTGEAESAGAVKDLATRGRKRGFCAVLATQRLSKLHKDAAAECNNKLIGRTGLDVDMKRAADELGLTGKEDVAQLRALDPGEFFAFGPAFAGHGVQRVTVGAVTTTHPKAGGHRAFEAPPATAKIKALLPSLADLPAEAEGRQRTLDDLKRENAGLRRELTQEQQRKPIKVEGLKTVEKFVLKDGQLARLEKLYERLFNEAERHAKGLQLFWDQQTDEAKALLNVLALVAGEQKPFRPADVVPIRTSPTTEPAVSPRPLAPRRSDARRAALPRPAVVGESSNGHVKGVEQRILNALAELEQLGANEPPRELLAIMAGYTNLTSKGFANAIGALRTAGHVDYPTSGTVALSPSGAAHAHPPDAPTTPEDVQDRVIGLLGGASGKILRPLIDAYPGALPKVEVAAAAGYGNLTSKGFANAIGRLRTLGFIDYPSPGTIVAKPVLFLEA